MSFSGELSTSPSSTTTSSPSISITPPTFSSIPSLSPAILTHNNLTPTSFLARTEGGLGQTSVEAEVWDAAHRLYTYVASCQRSPTAERLTFFRRLVRLCLHNRSILLKGVSSLAVDGGEATFEACGVCHRREYSVEMEGKSAQTTGNCCWFRPDNHARGFLRQVLALCDNHPELFGDEVSMEEFEGLFVFA